MERYTLSTDGMGEAQALSVEQLMGNAKGLGESGGGRAAIEPVSKEGMADGSHVYPYLMSTSGLQPQTKQAVVL